VAFAAEGFDYPAAANKYSKSSSDRSGRLSEQSSRVLHTVAHTTCVARAESAMALLRHASKKAPRPFPATDFPRNQIGTTRRQLNFFRAGSGLLHCSHPSLTWFELLRGSQLRLADNGNTHSIRVFDSRSRRSMRPMYAGPVLASVRPAARVRRHRRNFTILRHAIDFAKLAEKSLDPCLTRKVVNDTISSCSTSK
jgi:hypothetical protein